MSRVEEIAPAAVRIGMRVRFRVHRPGGGEPPYPVFVPWADSHGLVPWRRRRDGRAAARLCRDRRHRRIRFGRGRQGDEPDRSDGARHPAGACRLRSPSARRRRLICATTQSRTSGLALSEYLGISPDFIDTTILGGSSFMFHVAHAQAALQLGLCKVAVIAYGSTQRTVGRRQASVREYNPYETPFRPFLPATAYALAASRHMHQYGTTREQLAAVAVAAREWALLNPAAWEKKPLTIDEVLSARMSYPFTVRDCCLVTDGGGAVIMTTAERARALKKPPIYVLGCGQAITHANISSMPDLTVTGALTSGRAAYEMARLGPSDIDVVELYDAFTINTILFLEDLGFCPKGEGGLFLPDGHISPGGGLPVNTNGGGLSYCHPGMYGLFLLIEAARQLRRECGARQIADCETAIAHGNGGVLSSHSTVILGTQAKI